MSTANALDDGMLLGVDIGGTFTDVVAIDPHTGDVIQAKTPTTPEALENGLRRGVELITAPRHSIKSINHGTTVITNALLEKKLAKTAVLCTRGFRDILEFKRLWRERLFGYDWERPEALVPRDLRFEVDERVGRDGDVIIPLDERGVRAIAERLRDEGIEAVAIAYLFSFKNPAHELRTAEILHEELHGVPISTSAELLPEIYEYERTSTATVNALVRPLITRYMDRVHKTLAEIGIDAPLRMVRSDGALMTPKTAEREPFRLVNSGPAAGVIGASRIGAAEGWKHVITLDMGGTTTDVSLIWNGIPQRSREYSVLWDTPVRASQVDIRSIGAGGGSIVGLDSAGLFIGPRSAGASPGPACYGHGGTDATVVDALLVLGALPETLAHGQLTLDVEAARTALLRAMPGYTRAESAAAAVYAVTLSKMAVLIREITVNQGYDPRDCILMCFGGAGGVFAVELARELKIATVCLPLATSVFSAFGAALSRPVAECVVGISKRSDAVSDEDVHTALAEALSGVRRQMADDGEEVVGISMEVDLKYRSQPETLSVEIAETITAGAILDYATNAFHAEHTRLYHLDRSADPVDVVHVRGLAYGAYPTVNFHGRDPDRADGTLPRAVSTRTWFQGGHSIENVPVTNLDDFDAALAGPAFLQDDNTTIAIPPASRAYRSAATGAVVVAVNV